MKDIIINKSLNLLNETHKYDSDTLDRVRYGLEIIYISVTKMIVILFVSYLLNLLKETLLVIVFVNGLRKFAYGMHAKKSWHCYVYSITVFVLLPYVFRNMVFSMVQKIIISIVCFIGYLVFAPADTHKRPLINKKHRIKLKISTLIVSAIYIFIIFVNENLLINNMIILSMIIELFFINPIIYNIFDLPYNNYKTYQTK